jgi:ABC-2 type transport system permease protein
MQVYKAFFKIIHKNLPEILIYISIFLFFAVFLSSTGSNTQITGFTETKSNIVFINYDKDSKLIEGLRNYLEKNAALVDMEDDTKKLQDALFYREIEYIVKVPEGFTEGLLNGKDVYLEKTTVPDSAAGIYIDITINKYFG